MEKLKIDFLKEKYHLAEPKKKHLLFFGRVLVVVLVVTASIGAALSYHVSSTGNSAGNFPKLSLLSTLRHFVDGDKLKGEENDRVNILLMGIGGEGHDGPQLTDTIIFASYQPSTGKIGLMSLPRDMSVPISGYGYRKVNHANAYGEVEKKGSGPKLASEVIGQVLNEPIEYYVRVDFDGFGKLIDDIGGVDVYVDRAFTDPTYPTPGREYDMCGYTEPETTTKQEVTAPPTTPTVVAPTGPNYSCRFETLTFQEGWKHMDGETALKFVRSRHGTNGEGSDFARSARQQKVLLAIKNKVFSLSTFVNPARITRILETLQANIATNLSTSDILRLAQAAKKLDESQITHHVIDASNDSPLYAAILNGAYVLLPKNDDWKPLQQIAEYIFTPKESQERIAKTPGEKPKFVKVEIQNGTARTGLAFRASQLLDGQGFDVVKVGNAASREYSHTVIYDLTNGERKNELKVLRDFFKADVTLSATGWMVGGDVIPKELAITSDDYEKLATEDQVDFLVILGENSSSLVRN
ncbi:MAG: LCP family protein [Patescibacteria group bacterium]